MNIKTIIYKYIYIEKFNTNLAVNIFKNLSSIRKDWNEFYKSHPNPTKKEVIDYMTELDKRYGDKFTPPVNK